MGITEIQFIFLFASYKKLSLVERTAVKNTVAEQYARQFDVLPASVHVQLYDGNAMNNTKDIIMAIESDTMVMNEGVLRGRARDAIAEALCRQSAMMKLGFSGKIGLKSGLIDAKDNDSESAPDHKHSANQQNEGGHGSAEDKVITDNMDYKKRAMQYVAKEPKYSFDMLKISPKVRGQIDKALGRIKYEREVFDQWGLYAIMPSPVCAMSFYGPAGTGKSMAAEAIAAYLEKPIIRASYADIENKYVGEGPKNVSAVFLAAEQQDAVLLIDEADSLLSKRLVNVSDPSGQAMNSMRSQLLICLENFHGIVIFTTNLQVNYDRAFLSRLINIKFEFPDADLREEIWRAHIYPSSAAKVQLKIPLDDDVDLRAIAERYMFVGREIRSCVVDACVDAHVRKLGRLTQDCLIRAADAIEEGRMEVENARDETGKDIYLTAEQRHMIAEEINARNREKKAAGKEIDVISASELETNK